MFQRLLAALIVLAMLVLVMFFALPYTPGGVPVVTTPSAPAPSVEPRVVQTTPAKPETPVIVAKPETPVPSTKPETPVIVAKPDTPVTVAKPDTPVTVPNPGTPPPTKTAAQPEPAPAESPPAASRTDRITQAPADSAPSPSNKVVKRVKSRDELAKSAEPPPQPNEAAKGDRLKINHPNTVILSRAPRRASSRVLASRERESDDDIGDYIRSTGYDPRPRRRSYEYDCADGRCECNCDRPYWARRGGPPCWD